VLALILGVLRRVSLELHPCHALLSRSPFLMAVRPVAIELGEGLGRAPSGILINSAQGSLRLPSQETPAVRHAVLHDRAVFRVPTRRDEGLAAATRLGGRRCCA
jgi:hypothetical protein